jgi:DNA polymerase beta
LQGFPETIVAVDQLKGVPGFGSSILDLCDELMTTGSVAALEKERADPLHVLGGIYGVGPKKARELVDQGITTIEALRGNSDDLNDVQRLGLRYYEDILQRIPRAEIEAYEAAFLVIGGGGSCTIVGSYRRGAADSGDIDVIVSGSGQKFVDALIKKGIILHVLSRGNAKCLVIARLPGYPVARRVDFLFLHPKELPFALLYFTGSKYFNTTMRRVALNKGYTMNEHGLYHFVKGKKGALVDVNFTTEKDVFDFLGLVYRKPEDRKNGSIQYK